MFSHTNKIKLNRKLQCPRLETLHSVVNVRSNLTRDRDFEWSIGEAWDNHDGRPTLLSPPSK